MSAHESGKVFHLIDKIIPVISAVVCLLSLSTPFTHSTFYLDDANRYHRTLGAYAVPVYAYVFLLYVTVKLQITARRSLSLQVLRDANILSLFAIPCIFFSLVQVLLYGTTVAQVGFTMALMIVYIGRQRNSISRDELTGLNNRRQYEYAIDRMTRSSGVATIAMIDVNDFKGINDTYGHQEGDVALKIVAMILRNACADRKRLGSISLYRYGGDEFIILASDPNVPNMKALLAESIQLETEKWNTSNQKPYTIGLSVGIASGSYTGKDISKLVTEADHEMYLIKQKGKHR